MSLIYCPDCSTQVSDRAERCPKCARPIYNSMSQNTSSGNFNSNNRDFREIKSETIIKKQGGCFDSFGKLIFFFIIIIIILIILSSL
jgi:uncharacterized membrane protein YvbJ